MRILVVGAGGVGSSVVPIAARRDFFEHIVVADYDPARAERTVARLGGDARFIGRPGRRLEAPTTSPRSRREHRITHVLNAVDPRFVMPIFDGAFAAGADYLDMAMSLSHPHPERAPRANRASSSGTSSSPGPMPGRPPGGSPSSGIGVEPGSRTSSLDTRPITCSARSTRSASGTARTSSSTATTSRRRSRSGRRSRSA